MNLLPTNENYTLGVISDIHGNYTALEAVLSDMVKRWPILKVFCVGDIVGYGPKPSECLQKVLQITHGGEGVVKGNHDEAVGRSEVPKDFNNLAKEACQWQISRISAAERLQLYRLPTMLTLEHGGRSITLVHGGPEYPLEQYVYLQNTDDLIPFMELCEIDILLMGHTHTPFTKKGTFTSGELTGREWLVVNCGSVGQPRDGDPRASYAVIDADNLDAQICRVSYDIDKVVQLITVVGLPLEMGTRLYYGV